MPATSPQFMNLVNSMRTSLTTSLFGFTSSVQGTGIPGWDTYFSGEANTAPQLFIYSAPNTSATDSIATLRVDRNVNYSGGTPGDVRADIWALHTVGPNVTDFEWAILGEMQNSAIGGQNVAGYFQGTKLGSGVGPTWGAVCQVVENTAGSSTGTVGLEVDVNASGSSNSSNRVGIDIVGGPIAGGGTPPTIGFGWRVGAPTNSTSFSFGGYFNVATYGDLIGSTVVNAINGLNLSNVICSGAPLLAVFKTIPTSTSTGQAGSMCWDPNFIYVCVGTNMWKRAILNSW